MIASRIALSFLERNTASGDGSDRVPFVHSIGSFPEKFPGCFAFHFAASGHEIMDKFLGVIEVSGSCHLGQYITS